jgi:hypothetical protein
MARHLDDWIAETPESIAARLAAAREAQRQTRFTLGILALISMMMLILAYNAYLSFDSRWILERAQATQQVGQFKMPGQPDTIQAVLTIQALQDWAASRNATIELLGIRVSVDDAPVLGTTSLLVVSLWLLLVTRRENHTVGSLLRDTDSNAADDDADLSDGHATGPQMRQSYSDGQRWLIFHSIVANSLFVTFDRVSRIDSLRGANPLFRENATGIRAAAARGAMSFARDFFFRFPAAVSLLVFCLDRYSYFQPDPFAPDMAAPGIAAPWFWASAIVFVVCWVPLFLCCRSSARFSRATTTVLRAYGERLQSDLLRRESRQAAGSR